MATLLCPNCQHVVGTIDAGIEVHQTLVSGTIDAGAKIVSAARIDANRRAGLSRAASARRYTDGRFMSRAEADARHQEYLDWLYAVPGRAGGVERALFADRDELGCFTRGRETKYAAASRV